MTCMGIEGMQKLGGRRGFEPAAEQAAKNRERIKQKAEALKARYPSEIGWMEDVIGTIDFKELRSVFLELTARSNVAEEDVNFVPPADIFIVPPALIPGRGAASFKTDDNIILASAQDNIDERQKRGDVKTRQLLFYRLVHEYCHAVGATRAERAPFKDRTDADLRERTIGYAKRKTLIEKNGESEQVVDAANSFVLFNEGVTDEIAHRVLTEYLSRKDFFGMTAAGLSDTEKEGLFSSGSPFSIEYRTARTFADMLVERISKVCEVPKDVVWNAVIGDYFRGTGLPKELLDEIVGRSFTYNLGKSQDASDLKDLAKYFNFPDPRPGTIERIKSYLRGGITFE
jgi:hypothetical protein